MLKEHSRLYIKTRNTPFCPTLISIACSLGHLDHRSHFWQCLLCLDSESRGTRALGDEEKGHAVTVERKHSHGNHGLANCSALIRAGSPVPTELGVLLLVLKPSTGSRIQTAGSSSPTATGIYLLFPGIHISSLEVLLLSCGALGRLLAQCSWPQLFSFVLQNTVPFVGSSGISISEEATSDICSNICNYIPGLVFTIILFLRS